MTISKHDALMLRKGMLLETHHSNALLRSIGPVWLEDILSGPYRPSFVFLKVPSNYHSTPLQFLPNVKSVRSFKIRSYILVCVSIY